MKKKVAYWILGISGLIAVFCLTANAAAATLIPALLAAAPALRTGWWIRQAESRLGLRIRAATLWYFYLADAFWLAAASGFSSVLLLVILNSLWGFQPDMTAFATASLTILAGVVFSTLLGLYAAWCAWRHSIRVWVHPQTFRWAHGSEKRLQRLTFVPPRFNHGTFVLGTSLVAPSLFVGTGTLIAFTATGTPMNAFMQYLSLAIMLLFFLVLPIILVGVYLAAADKILAQNPSDCWRCWMRD